MSASLTDDARHKHELVRRHLLDAMRDRLGPRDRLPSERELAERLGVSRPTVRRALDQMAAEGRVHRVHGAGTFVADQPARRGAPLSPHARVLVAQTTTAGAARSWKLGISPAEPIWHLERLRFAEDGDPMCVESVFIVRALAPRLLDHPLDADLHDELAEHYAVDLVRAEQSITATVLDVPAARLLDVAPLSPALVIERISWDQHDRRVELAQSLCRGDRYSYSAPISAL